QSTAYTRPTLLFFLRPPATPEIYTLSLHDALPICLMRRERAVPANPARLRFARSPRQATITACHCVLCAAGSPRRAPPGRSPSRSEEHTSELQSRENLVCRLLLEKKKKKDN